MIEKPKLHKSNFFLLSLFVGGLFFTDLFSKTLMAAVTPFSIMGSALPLQGQPNWGGYFAPSDSPEGAVVANIQPGVAYLDGTIQLPVQLPAGQYFIFFKGGGYNALPPISCSFAGQMSAAVVADDRDANGAWTNKVTVNITAPVNTMVVRVNRSLGLSLLQKFLFRGIYITSNPNEIVTLDMVIDMTPSGGNSTDPLVKGNLIKNSSFEVGTDISWSPPPGGSSTNRALKDAWDPTVGYDMKSSLKFDGASQTHLVSRPYHLKKGTLYTFSLWIKSSAPFNNTASIKLMNMYDDAIIAASSPLFPTTTWQRMSVSATLVGVPTADTYLDIYVGPTGNAFVWIDALQLEEGDLTAYQPSYPLEAGLNINKPGNIFYDTDPIQGDLTVSNELTTAKTFSLTYHVFDNLGQAVKLGVLPFTCPGRDTLTSQVDLSVGNRTGFFRVVFDGIGTDMGSKEFSFSVIPVPPTSGIDATSYIGVHPDYIPFQLEMMQRLGIKWARASSPAAFFRWSDMEPTDNNYIFKNSQVALAAQYGIKTMGSLGVKMPAWANQGGSPNMAAWEDFVEDMVTNYKGLVSDWEIWNEPNWEFPVATYAEMLKRACDAIERADPSAKIIGMGGADRTFIDATLASLDQLYLSSGWKWQNHLDALATHLYPGSTQMSLFTTLASSVPVWNTESGAWDMGGYQGEDSNFYVPGVNIMPQADASRYYKAMVQVPITVVTNFLESIGSGMTKYFYYDARQYTAANFRSTHSTMYEYDSTIRPKGVAYAIAGHFVDHATALGAIALGSTNKAFLFGRNTQPTLALWTTDGINRSLNVNLSASQIKVFDMMGNQITASASAIPFGAAPIYVVGQSISTGTFRTLIAAATVSLRADTTAPNLSILEAPSTPVEGTSFRVRWIAFDETSVPTGSTPEAIRYTFRLFGLSGTWSSWSATTQNEFQNTPPGTYRFEVQAQDEAGNMSPVVARDITITGGQTGNPGSFHPADINKDFKIDQNEMTSYGACWSTNCVPPNPPNPIPIGYVTSTGPIWRAINSVYHYDSTKTCPQCWVPGP